MLVEAATQEDGSLKKAVRQILRTKNCWSRWNVCAELCKMDGKIAEEGFRRQEENQKLEEEMCVRMDEPLKHEESSRKLVQNDSAAMKEEIRQIKLESGSTVCSEAITAVGTGVSGTFKTSARHCCSLQ